MDRRWLEATLYCSCSLPLQLLLPTWRDAEGLLCARMGWLLPTCCSRRDFQKVGLVTRSSIFITFDPFPSSRSAYSTCSTPHTKIFT